MTFDLGICHSGWFIFTPSRWNTKVKVIQQSSRSPEEKCCLSDRCELEWQ